MTRIEFISNPDLCRHLNELLNDPVMVEALAIGMHEMRPGRPDSSQGDIVHQAAMTGQRMEGAFEVIGKIRSLTIPKLQQQVRPVEYEEEVIKTMMTQGYSKDEAMQALKDSQSTQQNP